ncbi:MAG: phenylalanine--tRNA ligase subunit beta [Dehalococcoidia bacterium]|nr:MAG: phenylalanine--tRNA ligase subunit beta [Dehalococcoidia bacterium]
MKCSLKWLRQYVDITLSPEELAKRMTLAGTEVSRIEVIGGWENVYIGQIAAVNPHPNADRLRLATVSLGGEQVTVVCGAPNLVIGDKIAFAKTGANLIDGHNGEKITLKPSKIRGVLSEGMVCSEMELGLSKSHEGILVLPPDAPLGGKLADYMGDVVFDLEVTPNRPDMLSILGIAHEVAALIGAAVREPNLDYMFAGRSIDESVSVEIADAELCPRYCAALVTDVKIGESPSWLKEALTASGVRCINNVVDITNFVMLEYGQPLHAFDYNRIGCSKIIIRRAVEGEVLATLDGIERKLTADTLVITDPNHAIAVAGVMGGATSEVTPATTSILLEAASFKPASVHNTAVRLKLQSEASARFERGIRAELTLPAARRAVQLMVELCGGKAAEGIIDHYPGRKEPAPVALTTAEVKRILGLEVSPAQIEKTLVSLGCAVARRSEHEFAVTAPYWRSDLRLDADFIEDIARIMGYEHIPERLLSGTMPRQNPNPMLGLRAKIRQQLSGFGFQEIITYALTDRPTLEKGLNTPLAVDPLRVAHPMSSEQECLRTSLRGNVLAALSSNIRREEGAILLFETGHIYLPRPNDLPTEPEMLCGVLTATSAAKVWQGRKEPVDFFDAKGAVEGLMAALGVSVSFNESTDAGLRTGRQAAIMAGNTQIGVLGELHPKVAQAFELPVGTYLFEINSDTLMPYTLEAAHYEPLPRFPAVMRDLALVLDEAVSHKQVMDVISGFSLVKKAVLFDVYSGKQVAAGKKSLAYSLTFQSPDHTLTDAEVDKVLEAILKKLQTELGAALRA